MNFNPQGSKLKKNVLSEKRKRRKNGKKSIEVRGVVKKQKKNEQLEKTKNEENARNVTLRRAVERRLRKNEGSERKRSVKNEMSKFMELIKYRNE